MVKDSEIKKFIVRKVGFRGKVKKVVKLFFVIILEK